MENIEKSATNVGSPPGNIIAGWKAAQDSMVALDQANKELLEALASSQDEIEKLSREKMDLKQNLTISTEKLAIEEKKSADLHAKNSKLGEALEHHLKENEILQKVKINCFAFILFVTFFTGVASERRCAFRFSTQQRRSFEGSGSFVGRVEHV